MATCSEELNVKRHKRHRIEGVFRLDYTKDKELVDRERYPYFYKYFDVLSDEFKQAVFEYYAAAKRNDFFVGAYYDDLHAEVSSEYHPEELLPLEDWRNILREFGFYD